MKFLVSLALLVAGLGGSGYYYVQSGGDIPAQVEPVITFFKGDPDKEDISKRSADYQICHKQFASLLSDDKNHPSRAACDCFETRIGLVSRSVKMSVLQRLKNDYETATGAVLGDGRIPTTQAAWEFLSSCQMLPGQLQTVESKPEVAPAATSKPADPIPVDASAIEALLPQL